MSIAAASFHNPWDLPVRRTGHSRLPMSGDAPQNPFQNDKLLQEQLHQLHLQQQHVLQQHQQHHQQHHHHHQQHQQASPQAQSPEQAGAAPHQPRIGSELRLDSLDQQQDSAILQKFSSLSVRFGSAAHLPVDSGAGAKAPVSSGHETGDASQQPLPGQREVHQASARGSRGTRAEAPALPTLIQPTNTSSSSSSSSWGETCRATATEGSLEASQRRPVFASLDSAEEHSPPFSPGGLPIPSDSFFFSARAASFPPYSARTSPSAGPSPSAWCCCCGAGVCAVCRGATSPAPLRPSASHPAPTAYHPYAHTPPHLHGSPSLTPAPGAAPHPAHPGHTQGQAPHYPSLRPSFSSAPSPWLLSPPLEGAWQIGPGGALSPSAPASAPASIHGGGAAPAPGGGPGAAPGSAAGGLLGSWGLPQPQSPASTPDGSAHGAYVLQGLQGADSGHAQGAPSPYGDQSAQPTDGDWGFAMHPMESSSLSLSQDDSQGTPEVSSHMQGAQGGTGHARLAGQGSGDEEVDSLRRTAGSLSPARTSPAPPAAGAQHQHQHQHQLYAGSSASLALPSLAGLLPPSSALCTPPLPRCSSGNGGAAAQGAHGLGSLSPKSPGIRRGLSSFFGGKARSFTSLADVSGIQCIQELAKPVRHYNRRKRIAHQHRGEGCSPGGGAPDGGPGRRVGLGVSPGKEPRGLFKKAGGARQGLGIQAGLARAVAMGALDSQGREGGEGEEGGAREGGVAEGGAVEEGSGEAAQHACGMETVMEESAEGAPADQAEAQAWSDTVVLNSTAEL